jgi:hypothetical protein
VANMILVKKSTIFIQRMDKVCILVRHVSLLETEFESGQMA